MLKAEYLVYLCMFINMLYFLEQHRESYEIWSAEGKSFSLKLGRVWIKVTEGKCITHRVISSKNRSIYPSSN